MGFALSVILALAAAAPAVASEGRSRTRNVAIILYDGVELLDFAGPGEVFAVASQLGGSRGEPSFRVFTVSRSRATITSQRFVKVVPEYSIDEAPKPDLVVIPGGQAESLMDDPRFMGWTKKAVTEAELALSVCTGAIVLGKGGLLDGRTATTWYGAIDLLRETAPRANVQEGRRFVDQGHIITTAGVSAGIDGALHVVARLLGRAVADETARYMEYRWAPEAYLAKTYSLLNPNIDRRGRELQRAGLLENEKSWQEAAQSYQALIAEDPKDGLVWRRLACVKVSAGDLDGALAALRRAAAIGFDPVMMVREETCLAPLRDDPRLDKLLRR